MKIIKYFLIIYFSSLTPLLAFADSMPIKDGRYIGGAVTILRLTEQQKHNLAQPFNFSSRITLSTSQRNILKDQIAISEIPTKLDVIKPEVASKECTCGVSNVGLWFSKELIEVPHKYLLPEAEAEARKIID